MVRFHRKLSEGHKSIFSFIRNLQISLVFGILLSTLVLLEVKVVGYAGEDIFQLLKYAYLTVFCLELLLMVVYQVFSYFWKQEVFGIYIGKHYKLEEGVKHEKD